MGAFLRLVTISVFEVREMIGINGLIGAKVTFNFFANHFRFSGWYFGTQYGYRDTGFAHNHSSLLVIFLIIGMYQAVHVFENVQTVFFAKCSSMGSIFWRGLLISNKITEKCFYCCWCSFCWTTSSCHTCWIF